MFFLNPVSMFLQSGTVSVELLESVIDSIPDSSSMSTSVVIVLIVAFAIISVIPSFLSMRLQYRLHKLDSEDRRLDLLISRKLETYNRFSESFSALYASESQNAHLIADFLSAASHAQLIGNQSIYDSIHKLSVSFEKSNYVVDDSCLSHFHNCIDLMQEDYSGSLSAILTTDTGKSKPVNNKSHK